MGRFIDMPMKQKLVAAFGLLAAINILLIVLGAWVINTLADRQKKVFSDSVGLVISLQKLDSRLQENRTRVLNMVLTRQDIDRNITAIEETVPPTMDLMRQLESIRVDDPAFRKNYQDFRDAYLPFVETRKNVIFPALRAGRYAEALETAGGVQNGRYEKFSAALSRLGEMVLGVARRDIAAAEDLAHTVIVIFIIAGAAATIAGIFVALRLAATITEPLQQICDYAREIASGNLSVDVRREQRRDEFGALGDAFADMVQGLRDLSGEILGGINVIASSGSQILAATTQMAAGATQTATAVNETTVTVEEVKQTTQLSAEKAQHVSDIAQKAVQASQAGRDAVEDAVEGMRQIRAQMETVTRTIVRLSDLGQAIGEIISSVSDIAEQSNLLAVNAAIEAAKAGEHGKGFAVVAQEVRHLAGQSKEATAQVRTILGDIQKATSASVMATEQGGKAVETGMRHSSRAGETIHTLAETVEEAAAAAMQIAASSRQQLVGMDQIALAMSNIKTATTQHVSGTRQTEEASLKLHELGKRLKELASRFRTA